MFTLQHSLLALCNLLCEQENHLTIIQQGLIITLISMCGGNGSNGGVDQVQENDLIKDFCSLAFLNLSCSPDSRFLQNFFLLLKIYLLAFFVGSIS